MEKIFIIIFMIIVGALIGYLTNVIAIKLLFRPFEPKKILWFEIWGMIPKRRQEIAASIGDTVEKELLSMEDILDQVMTEENKIWLSSRIVNELNRVAMEKLPPMFAPFAMPMINEIAQNEIPKYVDSISYELSEKAADKIELNKMIEEKINQFPIEKVEEIIISISKRELKAIERLGGVLGGLIGLVQGVIFTIL